MSLLKALIRQGFQKLVDKDSNVIKDSEHHYGHVISEESIRLMCSLLTEEGLLSNEVITIDTDESYAPKYPTSEPGEFLDNRILREIDAFRNSEDAQKHAQFIASTSQRAEYYTNCLQHYIALDLVLRKSQSPLILFNNSTSLEYSSSKKIISQPDHLLDEFCSNHGIQLYKINQTLIPQ